MRRAVVKDLQLTQYKKSAKTVDLRTFKAETSGQGQVDVERNGASHQQDLHLIRREDVHGRSCDQ